MIRFYAQEYRPKVRRLLSLLLPVIGTELAMYGMNFFDAAMSGQAGAAELAGTAMAGNCWSTLRASLSGGLLAATPMLAHLIGAGRREELRRVVHQGFCLAVVFTLVVLLFLFYGAPHFYAYLGLAENVQHVAYWYGLSVGSGVVAYFLATCLRTLVDSLGYTNLTMKIYITALPVNAVLNYIFIFGLGPVPAYGGIGAGIATGITYWLIFLGYALCVKCLPGLREYQVFQQFALAPQVLGEYIRLGIPIGFSVFLEHGCFAMTGFLMAKFGTYYIAAHTAATNFGTIFYMVPCSISLAATILVGIEMGAKRPEEAHIFSVLAMQVGLVLVCLYTAVEYWNMDLIARIYTQEAPVAQLITTFMGWGLIWQYFDAVGAPLQGILRGHKDVKIPSLIAIVSFWLIGIPYGLYMVYGLGRGAVCYWQGLDIALCFNAIVLYFRYRRVTRDEG